MTQPISKWVLIRALVLTVAVSSLVTKVTTGAGDSNHSKIDSKKSHRIGETASNNEANATRPNDPADMKFSYKNPGGFRSLASKRSALVSQRGVYAIVGELKKRFPLPFEIHVVFQKCSGPDSYYDDHSHEIVICYELIDAYQDVFSRTLKSTTARDDATKGATVSMFLHEVAHALIDGWDLPITGREEDAADQFSTLLLISGMPDGDKMALDGADSYRLLADLEKGLEKDYSDPHSLDEQRFFTTTCLVYGHRPKQYNYLIRNGTIPIERAFECEEEYARVNKSWQTLLAPHLANSDYQKDARELTRH